MNNETFGVTFQYAVCETFGIQNSIAPHRVDGPILDLLSKDSFIKQIFLKTHAKPVRYLTDTREYVSPNLPRTAKCPHNFLLDNGQTFSVKTFSSGTKLAPKVIGQAGFDTWNRILGHLSEERIAQDNFKEFCVRHIEEIVPVAIDYALISDFNCWIFWNRESDDFSFEIQERGLFPEIQFEKKSFSFSRSLGAWKESTTVSYKTKPVLEIQQHKNRIQPKIRFVQENFLWLLGIGIVRKINNSQLGDSAELAICREFHLREDPRLTHNALEQTTYRLQEHYHQNRTRLFPCAPVEYCGTQKRKRGGASKSGVDFRLEGGKTLSLKTNQNKAYKVCPPEIGQPSPQTFDHYFQSKNWYDGKIDSHKFRQLVLDPNKAVLLLGEYVRYLNECDYLLWSIYSDGPIESTLLRKSDFDDMSFVAGQIHYSNDFMEHDSVSVKYGDFGNLGEFQIHYARNSLKFRFNLKTLLSIAEKSRSAKGKQNVQQTI
jgi:hypothetical protein